jgi:hypothetical protein
LFEFSIWLSRLRIERDFRDLTKKMKDRSKIPINRNSAKTSNEGCDPLSKGVLDERLLPHFLQQMFSKRREPLSPANRKRTRRKTFVEGSIPARCWRNRHARDNP